MDTHALHTDLYQLTMLASYFQRDVHNEPAVCELFVRRLPPNRRFLVAAGLQPALDYLRNLRITDEQVEALRRVPSMRRAMSFEFVEYLRALRFTGEVHAVPEGTIVFENEPLLRVEAPLGQAQIIETFLLSVINYQTMIASKAARVVLAARGRPLLEFGTRRTHPMAAVDVARAAYIAGFAGSSNVEAAYRFDVPARGTMAHMLVMAAHDEGEAFRSYAELFSPSTYLVDTYDTLRGTERALDVVGDGVSAVRLDSGDLADLSQKVRALLHERGRDDVKIVVSSDLDEYELQTLDEKGAWDMAGVGTRLATSDDAPSLGGVYKLVQIGDRPVAKFSEGKVTYPGAHQVYRHKADDGTFEFDHLGLTDERSYEYLQAEPLLKTVMQAGRVVHEEPIEHMRARAREGLAGLPQALREIGQRDPVHRSFYEVRPSENLLALLERCRREEDERHRAAVNAADAADDD
jgi:nicotinate phosphoribosyltransferase